MVGALYLKIENILFCLFHIFFISKLSTLKTHRHTISQNKNDDTSQRGGTKPRIRYIITDIKIHNFAKSRNFRIYSQPDPFIPVLPPRLLSENLKPIVRQNINYIYD